MRKMRPSAEKRCIYCECVKPRADFHVHRYTTRTGRESVRLNSACKVCHAERTKERKSGSKYRAQQRAYRAANREKRRVSNLEYRKRNPGSWFKAHLRSYGLTLEGYQSLHDAQGGLCRICRRAPEVVGKKARLHVDHDHETGAVRGLLCHQCNVILGLAQDSPVILRRLAVYLETQSYGSTRGLDPGQSTRTDQDQHAREAPDGSRTWGAGIVEDAGDGHSDPAAQVPARSDCH